MFVLLIIASACKQEEKPALKVDSSEEKVKVITPAYPENLTKVFNAHGGIDKWKTMKSLVFTMDKPDGPEVTSTNLDTRVALIESSKANIGFDGDKAWFLNKEEGEYKGYPPKYYYNLMFYFYAMPFILSDDGINYADVEPLVFEGVTYPGIQVTYNAGVGETPEDRYVLYYNSKTYKMEWLGYTVNFVPGIDTKELHFRKFGNWQDVNGLLLPQTITSYGFKNDKPTEAKGTTKFTDIKLSTSSLNKNLFAKPEKGKFVK